MQLGHLEAGMLSQLVRANNQPTHRVKIDLMQLTIGLRLYLCITCYNILQNLDTIYRLLLYVANDSNQIMRACNANRDIV